jgi:Lrp/AsnC family leucine-responsive transcriptional regulator
MESERLLDEAGIEILRALQDNARISFAELGRRVGMSPPAITERVRKMEEAGIIAGYHASVNAAKVGYPVSAFVRIQVRQEHFPDIITLARNTPEVRECHHASGEDAFVLKVMAGSADELERAVDAFRRFGQIHTSVIVSTPVEKYSP